MSLPTSTIILVAELILFNDIFSPGLAWAEKSGPEILTHVRETKKTIALMEDFVVIRGEQAGYTLQAWVN